MTREEAKEKLQAYFECKTKQIKGIWEECNDDLCDNCDLCYSQGNNGEHKESVKVAIKSLQAWDEVIADFEQMQKYNARHGLFEIANCYKDCIDFIKQKLGDVNE